jgi:hypothetical protein
MNGRESKMVRMECVRGFSIDRTPSYIYIYIRGEVWTHSEAIANRSYVIRWITTHEIRITVRVNLMAGAWTVWALGSDVRHFGVQ